MMSNSGLDVTPPRAPKQPRRALHGVLLVDKPLGWTSNDALQKCKGILRAEKGGHTGTLDPLATGLLPLCFGAATKFSQVSLESDKRYTATLHMGRHTSTGDGEGEVLHERDVACTLADIQTGCARFVGRIDQLPPMYSALKHEGRALYEYARQGIEIERPTRPVHIHRIDIIGWQTPLLTIDVTCSKGTYIRTLAQDIGAALGCGASLSALRRTGCGTLDVQSAFTIDALNAMDDAARAAALQPLDSLLCAWPVVQLPDDEAGRFLTGLRRRVLLADAPTVRVYRVSATTAVHGVHNATTFLGSAHITAGELIPDRLLSPIEILAQVA